MVRHITVTTSFSPTAFDKCSRAGASNGEHPMAKLTKHTPPPAPPREISAKPVVFDPTPKEERRPEPVDMDAAILSELKHELAIASIVMHVWKTKPRIFRMICIAVDVDYMDIYEWAKEKLRCT